MGAHSSPKALLMSDFSRTLFTTLRQMDDDSPWGLRGFALHGSGGSKQTARSWEVTITKELAKRLSACGVPARPEVPYPRTDITKAAARCDLVVRLGETEVLWIEVKHICTIWWRESDIDFRQPQRPDKKGSGLLAVDCDKLNALHRPDATIVAAVLVAYETDEHATDLAYVKRMLVDKIPHWQGGHNQASGEVWPSKLKGAPPMHRFFTRSWLWWQELAELDSNNGSVR